MLVIVVAVTSAFTTDFSKDSKEVAAIVTGHRQLDEEGTECQASNDCKTDFATIVCKVGNVPGGAQLWGMDENNECTVILYKP